MTHTYEHPESLLLNVEIEVNILSGDPPAGGSEDIEGYDDLP